MLPLGKLPNLSQEGWQGGCVSSAMVNMGQQMPWRQKMPGSAAPGARPGTTMDACKWLRSVPVAMP